MLKHEFVEDAGTEVQWNCRRCGVSFPKPERDIQPPATQGGPYRTPGEQYTWKRTRGCGE